MADTVAGRELGNHQQRRSLEGMKRSSRIRYMKANSQEAGSRMQNGTVVSSCIFLTVSYLSPIKTIPEKQTKRNTYVYMHMKVCICLYACMYIYILYVEMEI